jgi:hypothetical protein
MVQSMTLDYADLIPEAFWAAADSTAVHIKNDFIHSAFKLKKSIYAIMFGDKPSIKYLYPLGSRCYIHVPEEK